MAEQVIHQTLNGKYRLQIKRGAVKSVLGYKVEVNCDTMSEGLADLAALKTATEKLAVEPITAPDKAA